MLGGMIYNNQKTEGGLEEFKSRNLNSAEGSRSMAGTQAIRFDWDDKWLKGEEYYHILKNADLYAQMYNFMKYPPKTHPSSTYTNPTNGEIYFVEGLSVGSEFGFPRVNLKKKFKWKKMNFSTDLPKSNPLVCYIVASAMKCTKFFPGTPKEGPCFRMHAVVLKNSSKIEEQSSLNGGKGYILCHIRQVKYPSMEDPLPVSKRSHQEIESGDDSKNGPSPAKEKKVETTAEEDKALPLSRNAQPGVRILHVKPINVLISNGCRVSPKRTEVPVKASQPSKSGKRFFCNARKLLDKIAKYRKGSYVELYGTLSEEVQ